MIQFFIVPKLQVQNANAISSPFTYGFPAVTAFLGFAHALQRKHNQEYKSALRITGVGIISHRFQMLDHRDGFDRTLCLTANPLNEKGERASFVEEGRCGLQISLVLEVRGSTQPLREAEQFEQAITSSMKLAGGDILGMRSKVVSVADDRRSIRSLMPGYTLIERRDIMIEAMERGLDALDAIHENVAIHNRCELDSEGDVVWTRERRSPGWIVPIATGFHAVSPAGKPLNARDNTTGMFPKRFTKRFLSCFQSFSRFESGIVVPLRLNRALNAKLFLFLKF
jgi:CRISPR-associated protein Csy2